MKKTLLTLVAFLATIVGMAQDNLALNKTAKATSGFAEWAVDGNLDTRWESEQNNDQVWQVDLGSAQEFNTIQIAWEGAYTKTFTIEAGDNVGEDGYLTGGTTIVNIQNGTPSTDKNNPETYKLAAPVTARYIRFNVIERGTQWGNSFWEFRVFNAPEPVLTTITLAADKSYAKVGTPVTLSTSGKDQLGSSIDTGELAFSVTPADAGTITEGIYTPAKAGAATITVASGDVVSNAITVTAYEGDKIDLFTNWADRIEPLGEATTNSMVGAFDDNPNSTWDFLGTTTGNDEESRTYNVGFIADLGDQYDITALSIVFEGACSQEYTISFAGSNKDFGAPAFTYVGNAGINAHTDFWIGSDAQNTVKGARYVKFLSTKAATEWSVKIFDFSIYGTPSTLDATVPTLSEVTAEATGDNSIKVTATATDEGTGELTYTFTLNNEEKTTTGASGETVSVEFDGLLPGKAYTATVVVANTVGAKSEAQTATATTTGTPDPNLWTSANKNVEIWIGDANWSPQPVPEDYILGTNSLEITNTNAVYDDIWRYQVKIHTDIDIEAQEDIFYDFKCNITANNDIKYTIKLTDKNDNQNDYLYEERKPLAAGTTAEIKHVKMPSRNADDLMLIFDFGGAPANTTITISDILFQVNEGEEPEPILPFDYNDENNLWRTITDANEPDITSYYAHGNNWEVLGNIEWSKDGSEYTVNLPTATDNQWQAQFVFNSTGISTKANVEYDYSMIINPNVDLKGVSVKLASKADENNVYFFIDRYDLNAGIDNVIRYDAVKLSENIAELKLIIDFGGNPENTVAILKDIVFKETNPEPPVVDGINTLDTQHATLDKAKPLYNLAGQQVNSSYKGIVIKNGKKVLQ